VPLQIRSVKFADWPTWLQALVVTPHASWVSLPKWLRPKADQARRSFVVVAAHLLVFYLILMGGMIGSMRRPVSVSVALSSLFLVPAEVGIAQPSTSRRVDVKAIHALWISIKNQLTGPNAEEYFTQSLKNADVPLLIGTLVSATPKEQPSILVLSLTDGITPEVTLHLTDNNGRESHLNGPLIRGSQIQFEGIPVSFTQNPFMLTFDVTTDPKKQKLRPCRNNILLCALASSPAPQKS
jgi:hypothetical protein